MRVSHKYLKHRFGTSRSNAFLSSEQVADTPGLCDPSIAEETVEKAIIQAGFELMPGPNVFLLVIPIDRFTEEQADTYSTLLQLLGKNSM